MNTVIYVASVTGDQHDGYQAAFVDLPGCTAHASAMADLLARARDALRGELQKLESAGHDWPEPTPIERLNASTAGGGLLMMVDVQVDDQPVRVNISIGERLLKRIDESAEAQGMTRSGFIAAAARQALGVGRSEGAGASFDFEAMGKRLQDELSSMGRRISDSVGPESAFTRSMSELDAKVTDAVRKAADSVSSAMARRMEAEAATRTTQTAPEPEAPPEGERPLQH